MKIEYTLQDYKDYISNKYNDELDCAENEVYSTLQESEERVLELIDYNSCACFSCCMSDILEAIFIMTYHRLNNGNFNDTENSRHYEKVAYKFLKNRDCINF